jgi:hypothetical protein
MAWSSADLDATKRALAADDKPLLLGSNRLRGLTSSTLQWRTTGSFGSGSDGTSATGPTKYLWDGYTSVYSAPGSAQTTWYLIANLGSLVTFDAIWIGPHNFATIGGLTVSLEIAGDNAFSVNLTEIATWAPASSTRRLTEFVLEHGGGVAQTYTAQYVRLKMTKGATFTPQISEIMLGVRRQLQCAPDEPWDDSHLRSACEDRKSLSGSTTRYVAAKGQRVLEAQLRAWESTYKSDLSGLWQTDLDYGTRPLVWVDQPTTAPQNAPLFVLDPELSFPYVGPSERELRLRGEEQGPQFVASES